MGGIKVVFDKTRGDNYTRGKKRMRGGDIIRGSEVKKWNALYGSSAVINTSYDFVNNVLGAASGTATNFRPQEIVWPSQGASASQRVGNRINFKALRLKGWITLAPDQLKQIRWRLVLCRLDLPAGTVTFDANAYLSQFINADTNVPTSFDQTRLNTFTRHNFYKKFKNVENDDFKCKVLASGCLPPTNEYKKMHIYLSGTVAGQGAQLTTGTINPAYITNLHTENCGYLPIDVTVAINDTIDVAVGNRRYFLVLEADCGFGWTNEGSASGTEIGLLLNFFARGYFTDP